MREVTVTEVHEQLETILKHVYDTHEHVIVMRDNQSIACLISMEQLEMYQESDDGMTLEEMARYDPERDEPGIPLAEAMRQARALRQAREGR
jgi:PHD/YefM family antitoxin component YafN of YafNO toxin-antitoxin module